ncbi:MAG: LysR family transcriptional regulator [Clostridiales bacterium]|nr:LysR family transcriptional regulator [Clostridiales bacterium]
MSISKYKTFIEVARHESMRKAALSLNQTPSSVSYAISSLEDDLGLLLFTRSKSKITLTPAGQSILPAVKKVLDADQELKEAAAAFGSLFGGHIQLGGLQIAIARFLPGLIKKMQKLYPEISITPVLTPYPKLSEDLMSGCLDLAFMDRPAAKQLDFIPLTDSYFIFILPDSHPLIHKKSLGFDAFPNDPFIIPAWESDLHFQSLIDRSGIRSQIAYTISDINTLIAFVQSGFGIGILTSTTLPPGFIRDYPTIKNIRPVSFGIALPSMENASPAVKAFIRQVRLDFSGQ